MPRYFFFGAFFVFHKFIFCPDQRFFSIRFFVSYLVSQTRGVLGSYEHFFAPGIPTLDSELGQSGITPNKLSHLVERASFGRDYCFDRVVRLGRRLDVLL